MRIGLIDVDAESRGKVTFPNLSLMKISAFHKSQGDHVEWYKPLVSGHMDVVYISKVFGDEYTKDYEFPIDADRITQYVQPWEHGHEYMKRTGLWLKNLPLLVPTSIVQPIATWCPSGSYSHKHGDQHRGMFTKDRAKNRSKTFPGIARAMAEQWAGPVKNVSACQSEM